MVCFVGGCGIPGHIQLFVSCLLFFVLFCLLSCKHALQERLQTYIVDLLFKFLPSIGLLGWCV